MSPEVPTALSVRLLATLEDVVGRNGLVREPGRLLAYESDALPRFRERPAAVVLPEDTAQTLRVVRILADAGVPITPRGAGTGLSGGAVAAPGGVLIGTSRMNRILELDPRRRLARVQAGVINTDLSRAAAAHGLHYAPDPSSQTACTLGGNVGENAGGPHCLKYGVTTRYVTGLTVVGGPGRVLEFGGADRAEGLDLTGLFVGSEGRFGIATELELRLVPRPRGVRTLLAVFPDTETAGRAVSAIIARGLLPAALEMMDRGTIEAVEASIFAAGYPLDAGAVLVVEFDGTEAGLDADAALAEAVCLEEGATLVRRARDEAERAALWQGRKKAYGAFGRIAPDLMVQDATVPRSALPRVLRAIDAIGARYELRLANVFHAGDGNLHPKILFDRRDPALVARVEEASREIMQVCVEAGGTITGEHGVGLDKRDYMGLVHGAEELAAMAAVQRAFDPDGIWNPGKVLPLTPGSGVATEVEGGRTGGDSPIQHDPEDLTVRVAGEVVMGELAGRLARAGQWLPLDVPGQAELTVAELVASGEWGPLAPALGRLRDLVLGATVETAGRGRLRLGGRVMKNVAGFDLVRAVPGSHGRFGSIEEVVFRLLPLPETHRVLALEGASHGDPGGIRLVELADRLATHPVLPASLVRVIDGEGRSSIFVRLLGSRSGVEAECDELLALLPGATVWEGEVDTPGFVARDPLGSSLAWTREEDSLLELRGGPMPTEEVEARLAAIGLPARWSYHLPGWNVWRLALPPGALEAARHEMTDLAVGLREGGGDLNLLRGQGPDLGRHAPPGIPELEEAVRHAVAGTVGPIRVGGSAR